MDTDREDKRLWLYHESQRQTEVLEGIAREVQELRKEAKAIRSIVLLMMIFIVLALLPLACNTLSTIW